MYNVHLTESFSPAQPDAVIREITVGSLLREVATAHPNNIALVDIDDHGNCLKHWTYQEVLDEFEKLALALPNRFAIGEKVVVWAPNIHQWIFMEYARALSGLVLVTTNPSFRAKGLAYVLEQSKAVELFLVPDSRGNPMVETAGQPLPQQVAIVGLPDEKCVLKMTMERRSKCL